jgi:hypothetical protein
LLALLLNYNQLLTFSKEKGRKPEPIFPSEPLPQHQVKRKAQAQMQGQGQPAQES